MTGASAVLMGRLTEDPVLRHTETGIPVANFTVAHNPRSLDRATNEWKDAGEPLFMRSTVWRDQAENVAASLHKGDHVVAHGRLKARTYEHEGVKRTVIEFEADVVAVDLRRQSVNGVLRINAPAANDEWAAEGSDDLKAARARSAA